MGRVSSSDLLCPAADGRGPVTASAGDGDATVNLALRPGVAMRIEPLLRGEEFVGGLSIEVRDPAGVPVVDHFRPGRLARAYGKPRLCLVPGEYTLRLMGPRFRA
jgi:hypothetical protein